VLVFFVCEALQESNVPPVATAPTAHQQMKLQAELLRPGARRTVRLHLTDLSAMGE
jgi:hypothetical protein